VKGSVRPIAASELDLPTILAFAAEVCYRSANFSALQWVAGSKGDFLATAAAPAVRKPSSQAKCAMFLVYGLLIVVVYFTRDRLLLDPKSWLRQRYAPVAGLMLLHGIPGASRRVSIFHSAATALSTCASPDGAHLCRMRRSCSSRVGGSVHQAADPDP
jgi:hypothetical protein